MDCIQAYNILKRKDKEGVFADRRDLRYGINKVRFHHRNETLEHFICKCVATHILSQNDKGVISEAEFIDGRKVDVISVNRQGELIGYEIESSGDLRGKEGVDNVDLFVIDLRKMPKKAKEGLEVLRNWLKKEMRE